MAAFVDTNILIYAFADSSSSSAHKVPIARALLSDLSDQGNLILSAQVLSEFVENAMRKSRPPLPLARVAERVAELSTEVVVDIDASLVQLALLRVEESRISYWDALIVEAAIRSGATILYTEDMHHGTRYGTLELRNPFLAAPHPL
jgi:predicted nucleic acid-binding protein